MLYLVNLYLEQSVGEIFVVNKFVAIVYIFTLWNLG